MSENHILKFLNKEVIQTKKSGIKVFPRQTYGVSLESPSEFKLKNTLIADKGYIYKFASNSAFEYKSQQKNIHVVGIESYRSLQQSLVLDESPVRYHRKKGMLSQFMDKNGWTNQISPIMGYERSKTARSHSNRLREEKIKSGKSSTKYQNPVAKKPLRDPNFITTISQLMEKKLSIRKQRSQVFNLKSKYCSDNLNEKVNSKINKQFVINSIKRTNSGWINEKVQSQLTSKQKKNTFAEFCEKKQILDLQDWRRTKCSLYASQSLNDKSFDQEQQII